MKKQFLKLMLAMLLLVITACGSIETAIYDQYSYQQEISLRVETKNLLAHATEPYTSYKTEVEKLLLEMEKMEEYEKNKPNNILSYKMWQLMTDVDKNSVAGLFKLWKEKGQLSVVFLDEASEQVMEAFDALIKYEASKNKENESVLSTILSSSN